MLPCLQGRRRGRARQRRPDRCIDGVRRAPRRVPPCLPRTRLAPGTPRRARGPAAGHRSPRAARDQARGRSRRPPDGVLARRTLRAQGPSIGRAARARRLHGRRGRGGGRGRRPARRARACVARVARCERRAWLLDGDGRSVRRAGDVVRNRTLQRLRRRLLASRAKRKRLLTERDASRSRDAEWADGVLDRRNAHLGTTGRRARALAQLLRLRRRPRRPRGTRPVPGTRCAARRRPRVPARAPAPLQPEVRARVAAAVRLRRAAHRHSVGRSRVPLGGVVAHAARPLGAPLHRAGVAPPAATLTPMAQPATRNLGRLSEIAQVAVRHGFGYWFDTHRLTDLFPRRQSRLEVDGEPSQRGQHLREMLDELGPTFVKFGQLLSTRPDVLPPDIIAELRGLQDDVRPVPLADIEKVVEEDLGLTIAQLFSDFDERPVAAASIGQVHRATLPNGRRVAVKVQRPGAPRQIEADLALLYQAARIAKERVRALDFIDARLLVDEFARQIRQELDYRLEARNADVFHRNFAGHPHVRVPRVYWTYTRSRVLTLEWLDGTQVADIHPEEWALEDRRELAYLMAETWMTMIFRHGFFHGDPHPANILVLGRPDQIGLIDFGAVGKLTDDDMSKLTRMFIDAASENVDALPKRLSDLGVRYPKEREEEFLAELREIFYRYYGASLSEIDPLQIIREAFQLIYSMNLQLPTRFLLLDRAIATLGSVGVDLYPDFNVFEVARPYARGLLLDRFGPRKIAARARKEGLQLAEMALELPYQLHDTLEQVRDGQIEVGFVHKGLDDLLSRLDVVFNRLVVAMIVAGGLIGSSLIGIFAKGGPHVLGVNVISVIGFAFSLLLGMWLLWGVVRSGRL